MKMNFHSVCRSLIGILACFIGTVAFVSCSEDEGIEENNLTINLPEDKITIEVGSSRQLTAGFEPSDAPNKAHVWTTENPSIASVDETGKVEGVSVGTTRVTAKALASGSTATCVVNVVDKLIPVNSITLSSTKETLVVGSTLKLSAVVSPSTATERSLKWSSNNSSIASVDDDGVVAAISPGEANITVSAGGKTSVCAITVVDKSVDFSNIKYSLIEGGRVRIYGTINPQGMELSEIGVCYSTSTTPTVNSDKCVFPSSLKVDSQLKGLKPDTEYYLRIYAVSDKEVYYGKTGIIKTMANIVTDFKLSASYVDRYNNRNICEIGLSTPVISGYSSLKICYGVAPHPEITDNITNSSTNSTGVGVYTIDLKNLKEATTYYFRAYELINNKPVYYNTEGVFSTIGKDVKINATTSSYTGAKEWIYNLSYTLPTGTYEVTYSSNYSGGLSKTQSNWSSKIYVAGGEGSIFLMFRPWQYYEKYNGQANIFFKNMESGTSYSICVGRG